MQPVDFTLTEHQRKKSLQNKIDLGHMMAFLLIAGFLFYTIFLLLRG